jgi:XTP/dITP diphosphohydrolase
MAFADLLDRISHLRDPMNGCPWDRAQTHLTLRPYMLEEAYEAIAAIESGDPAALQDELGDVLLQVVLHAQIAKENGEFTMDDVIEGLIAKLTRRHPHVFGEASSDLASILRRWDDIKAQEPGRKPLMPPLVEARKLVNRGLGPSEAALDPEGMSEEEKAGLSLLSAVAEVWADGFEPELALRKAMAAVKRRVEEPS